MTLRKSLIAGMLSVASIASICTAAKAVDITYDVNQTIGTGGVTGTIETDGTIGVLGASDILNWNLAVNANPFGPFDLVGPPGPSARVIVGGGDLSATATQLLFDFSGVDRGVFIIATNGTQGVLFLSPGNGYFESGGGEVISIDEFTALTTSLSGRR